MAKGLPEEVVKLGPVRKEYKADPLAVYGLLGSIALLGLVYAGIMMCRSAFDGLQNEGFSSILNSPLNFICGPLAFLIGAAGILLALAGITDRVVVCRDGFAFLSRFPRKIDTWRWEEIEDVTHIVKEDKKTRHKIHTYKVSGKNNKQSELSALQDIQVLGTLIEEEVSKVKQMAEIDDGSRNMALAETLPNTIPPQQDNEQLLAVFDIYRFTEEQIRQIRISPDKRHLAYVDFTGDKFWVTRDQQVGQPFQAISKDSLSFSPDSNRFAYVGGELRSQYLMIDDAKYGPFTGVIDCSPQFSPDSRKIAYATQALYKVHIYVDEAEVFTADQVGNALVFSPNSQSFAFRAGIGDKQCIVVDGQQGPCYDQVDNPHFSPDNQRLAYAAKRGEHWFIVVDGEEGPCFKDAAEPVFSPDSKRIAYYADAKEGRYLVVDDQLIGPHFSFGQAPFGLFKFSPSSQQLAYVVQEAKKFLFVHHGHTEHVVANGQEGRRYQRCGNLVFSPNSQQLGYLAYADNRYYAIIGEACYGPYQDLRNDSPVFGPDSQASAFSAYDLGVSVIYVNGQARGSYRLAYTPIFGPDGQHFAYGAFDGDDWRIVIDETPGKVYKDLMCLGEGCVKFDSPHELHYIASLKEAPDHWCLVTETF